MEKNKLFIGMVTGAVIGGLVTLIDKTTREYTREKIQDVSNKTKEIIQNPSGTLQTAKSTFDQFNDKVQSGADNAINAFEQVESTLDRLSKKRKDS